MLLSIQLSSTSEVLYDQTLYCHCNAASISSDALRVRTDHCCYHYYLTLLQAQISFVDERGFVINNKDGRLHGRLGPSLFGNGGHMHFSILQQQQQQQSAAAAAAAVTQSTVTTVPPPPPAQRGASDDLMNSPVKSLSSVLSSSSLGSPTVAHSASNSSAGNSTTTAATAGAAAVGTAAGSVSGASSMAAAASARPAVCYGDACVMVAKKVRPKREGVTRAHVTHFRRRQQRCVHC